MKKTKFNDLTDQEREWFIEAKEALRIGDKENCTNILAKLKYTTDLGKVNSDYSVQYGELKQNVKGIKSKPIPKKSVTTVPAWGKVVFILVAFMLIGYFMSGEHSVLPEKDSLTLREKKINKTFSGYDGSHFELNRTIKRSMNDPNSYEHVSTSYSDKGDYLLISTTFRGKNAFGGVVKNTVSAKSTVDGNIIEIIK
jgi:hypothetical protein